MSDKHSLGQPGYKEGQVLAEKPANATPDEEETSEKDAKNTKSNNENKSDASKATYAAWGMTVMAGLLALWLD